MLLSTCSTIQNVPLNLTCVDDVIRVVKTKFLMVHPTVIMVAVYVYLETEWTDILSKAFLSFYVYGILRQSAFLLSKIISTDLSL